jgi:predicted Zn-dependent peptidase
VVRTLSNIDRYGAESALGHPVLCPQANFDKVTPAMLREFVDREYRPENVVIAAVGVEHARLVEEVQRHFDSLPVRA